MSDRLPPIVKGARLARRGLGSWTIVALGAAPFAYAACGGPEKPAAVSPGTGLTTRRSETIEHESCDVTGSHVEALDTNGDGKADIRTVYDGSKHVVCRVVDLNHDGQPDLYEYFDSSGVIRRREFCYDDTGEVNAVEFYEGGKLASREYDTTGQHKIDTWDWFDPAGPVDAKTGRPAHPVRRERDTHGDGNITQWWTWAGDKVSIATDRNGDGKPDPESLIVLGGTDDGGTAPPPASATASPTGDGGAASTSVAAATSDGGSKP
jgi:hypothetical protein